MAAFGEGESLFNRRWWPKTPAPAARSTSPALTRTGPAGTCVYSIAGPGSPPPEPGLAGFMRASSGIAQSVIIIISLKSST